MKEEVPAIGVIGGSGLYQMEGLEDTTEQKIDTPFGPPSDALIGGKLNGRQVYFLPRHARGHRLLPHELNHRANIYALRSLNVRWIIAVTAVGSLQEKYAPRDVLLPSQFYDRTSPRSVHTFFGNHFAVADIGKLGSIGGANEKPEGMDISMFDRDRHDFIFTEPECPVDGVSLRLNVPWKFRFSAKSIVKHTIQVLQRGWRRKDRHAIVIRRTVAPKIIKSDHVICMRMSV